MTAEWDSRDGDLIHSLALNSLRSLNKAVILIYIWGGGEREEGLGGKGRRFEGSIGAGSRGKWSRFEGLNGAGSRGQMEQVRGVK